MKFTGRKTEKQTPINRDAIISQVKAKQHKLMNDIELESCPLRRVLLQDKLDQEFIKAGAFSDLPQFIDTSKSNDDIDRLFR